MTFLCIYIPTGFCLHHLLPPVKKVCYILRTPYELIVHKLKQTRCSYLVRMMMHER